MRMNPYLSFSGNCEEAFGHYVKILGGKIDGPLTWGNSPMKDRVEPDWHDKVMHAQLRVGEQVLMGADAPPGCAKKPQGFSVVLNYETAEEAARVYAALSEGGDVIMPLEETFWAERFGMCIDRFGIPWSVNGGMKAA